MDTIVIPHRKDPAMLRWAASLLLRDEIVAFPTETVYGLGARIFSPTAIAKIYRVKKRPADNPLIAHISSLEMISGIAHSIPPSFTILSQTFFPGPLTIVLPKRQQVPDIATSGLPTIGVRMPNHPIALELIRLVGEPLVAPSANLSGKPSPTTALDVLTDLKDEIPCIIDGGPCAVGIESTVIDITRKTPLILRPGIITKEELEKVLHQEVEVYDPNIHREQAFASPGMRYRHYAPQASVLPITSWSQIQSLSPTEWVLSNQRPPIQINSENVYPVQMASLFSTFRLADRKGVTAIYVYIDDALRSQSGLFNRIMRAAAKDEEL